MIITFDLNTIEQTVLKLLSHSKSKTLLLYGSMGVGKTTLVKAIVKSLGSKDIVSSPTFSIVNEYELNDEKIYHFDLYRIQNLEEAYNLGIEDYLDSENWKLIEWPEKIEPILEGSFDKIILEIDESNNRILKFM